MTWPDFNGKIVLVTGGVHGVGRAISWAFAERGAHVIITYFRSWQEAPLMLEELRAAGGSAELLRASVTSRTQVDDLFDTIAERHGGLDVLVNNAANGALLPFEELADAHWRAAWEVDLRGSMWCARKAVPLMVARGGGAIVNLSAIGSPMVLHGFGACGTAKAAVEALTRYQAVEYAPRGIRVNAASGGLMDNPVATQFPDAAQLIERVKAATPLGHRLGREQELAQLVVFLASPEASWVTGQTVLADGGLSLGSALLSPGAGSAGSPRVAVAPQAPATSPKTSMERSIAVVAMGSVTPGSNSPGQLWDLLSDPVDVFEEPGDRFDIESFWSPDSSKADRSYTRVSGFIKRFRPHPVLAAEIASGRFSPAEYTTIWLRHCLLQASDATRRRQDDRVACFIGAWPGGSPSVAESMIVSATVREVASRCPPGGTELGSRLRRLLNRRYPHSCVSPTRVLPYPSARAAIAGVLPEGTDLVCVDTACSSSLYAIDLGAKSILAGDCDIAFCGGVSALDPIQLVLFSKLGGLSRSGRLRSLDRHADGTLFSDAAGIVALKPLRRAIDDGDEVLGLLAGFGAAADGRGKSIAAPNPRGQQLAIRRARAVNNTDATSVDWIVAHATGTLAGDTSELQSLAETAPPGGILCSSDKAVVGHGGWAAGVTSLTLLLHAMRHGRIPAQYGFVEMPRGADSTHVHVPTTATSWPADALRSRMAGISSFGFGGTSAHLLISEYRSQDVRTPAANPLRRQDDAVLVGWSGHLPGNLSRQQIADWLAGTGPAPANSFGSSYPASTFDEVRLPQATAAQIDRCQVMALEVAHRFVVEHGEIWADHRATTGVIAAHSGVPQAMADYALRAYATDLAAALNAEDEHAAADLIALEGFLDEVRRKMPAPNEDSMPGIMPNVIASRIANRFDLQGISMLVDAGRSSTYGAISAAQLYLATGELDLALVVAANGNSSPDLAIMIDAAPGQLAEGAFLLALASARVARQRGWPILARLAATPASGARPSEAPPPSERTYLGADGAVSILRALHSRSHRDVTVSDSGPVVTVGADDSTAEVAVNAGPMLTSRFVPVMRTTPAPPRVSAYDPRIVRTIVVGSEAIAAQASAEVGGRLAAMVVTDDDVSVVLDQLGPHMRVIVSATPSARWPDSPSREHVRLHELIFRAAQRSWSRHESGSLGVLMLDDFAGGVAHPHSTLFTGLTRSLQREHPHVRSCTLLTNGGELGEGLDRLECELESSQCSPVVWYKDDQRQTEHLLPQPIPAPRGQLVVQDDSVVVVTGGSSGIITESLAALAAHARPKLWLLGSTDLGGVSTQLLEAHDADLPALRAQLIADGLRQNQRSVREMSYRADRMIAARAAARNIRRLRGIFGDDRVRYVECDVTDRESVKRAVAGIYAEETKVDLLVHAAGRNNTAPMDKKTINEFRAVLAIKLMGYHHLKAAFSDRPPRLWCNMGSLTSVYPVIGEIDYGTANEFLAAAARSETALRTTTEWTIGPALWSEAGFASTPMMISHLAKGGQLTHVPSHEGVTHVLAELSLSRPPGPASVYLGDIERAILDRAHPGYVIGDSSGHAYLAQPASSHGGSAEWTYRFAPGEHEYLHQHLVQGKPTLPGVFMLEIAAEAAAVLVPDMAVRGFRDACFDAFIRPFTGQNQHDYHVTAHVINRMPEEATVHVTIESRLWAPPDQPPRWLRHFRTEVMVCRTRDQMSQRQSRRITGDRRVTCPYYEGTAPVHLSGIFQSTRDWRIHDDGASATWQPDLRQAPILRRMIVPALVICAALRTCALKPIAAGVQQVLIPHRLPIIDVFIDENDVRLAARFPGKITLHYDATNNVVTALDSHGKMLLRIQDPHLAAIGTVRMSL